MCCKLYTSKCMWKFIYVYLIYILLYTYTYIDTHTLSTHTYIYIFGLRDGEDLFLNTIKYFGENYVALYDFVIQVVPVCFPPIGFWIIYLGFCLTQDIWLLICVSKNFPIIMR